MTVISQDDHLTLQAWAACCRIDSFLRYGVPKILPTIDSEKQVQITYLMLVKGDIFLILSYILALIKHY